MDTKTYNKLLKYVYFEGYADSYEDAEQLIEEVDDEQFDALYEEFVLNEATESILEHLVSEGFADDKEAATAILSVMSDEWLDQIMEVKITPATKEQLAKLKDYAARGIRTDPENTDPKRLASFRAMIEREYPNARPSSRKKGPTLGDANRPRGGSRLKTDINAVVKN